MGKLFGIKSDETLTFISKHQKDDPEEDQVKFFVRPLTVKEFSDIQDELFQSKGFGKKREEKFLLGKQTWLALRVGLRGWENFKHRDDSLVEWEDPSTGRDQEDKFRIMDKNLNKIPPEIRSEIADYIRGESTLGEAE